MITSTDTYLRMPSSGYLGRSFTVYLEPMSAPGQVNSRNYLQDYYYLVISPSGENIHMDALRHTYLHFVLDPLIAKRATALQRLKPILVAVQKAPMAEDYKLDPGLLVIECLIRAIEARTPFDPKLPDKDRQAMVQRDEAEGFVFTSTSTSSCGTSRRKTPACRMPSRTGCTILMWTTKRSAPARSSLHRKPRRR